MENINKKTITIGIIGAVVIVAAIIALAMFTSGGKKTSEKDLEEVTEIYNNYIFNTTMGFPSQYFGLERFYNKDEIKYEDLHRNVILNNAVRYAQDNLTNGVSSDTQESLKSYGYDLNKYTVYNAESLSKAVKELYGKELEHASGTNDNLYGYDFIYVSNLDVYVRSKTKTYNEGDGTHYLDYKIINSTTKKDKVYLDIVIGYVHEINDKVVYTSDADANKIVFETTKEAPGIKDDKIEEFQKYTITFNRTEKNNFTFESIKKVK